MTDNGSHIRNRDDFSLRSVCWGYRDTFARAIEGLYKRKLLGPEQEEITRKFFDTLQNAEKDFFDHVLHEFLKSLNPKTYWIMSIPSVFSDVTDMGIRFAEHKLYYGTAFFRILGDGGFGSTPREVRDLITFLRRIWETSPDLSFAFLKGYRKLLDRLTSPEISLYIETGIEVFHRSRKSGLRYMECSLKSSEAMMDNLASECRLQDVKEPLVRLLRALVGWEVEVANMSGLDSDALIERGTGTVCMYRWLYLPDRVRAYTGRARNRDVFLLMAVVAAGLLSEDSFCRVHGHPDYTTCEPLAAGGLLGLNLLQILEYVRAIRRMRNRWPGAASLLREGFREEALHDPPTRPPERLLYACLYPQMLADDGRPDADLGRAAKIVTETAGRSHSVFDTSALLREPWIREAAELVPGLDSASLRPFSFLPDFLYPGEVSAPTLDQLVVDLKEESTRRAEQKREEQEEGETALRPDSQDQEEADEERRDRNDAVEAVYMYDEWSQSDNDYFRDHCHLREVDAGGAPAASVPAELADQVSRTRRVFEHLKPAVVHKEKYLRDGDMINPDLLVEYLTERRHEPSPKIRFYERPQINRRDLAVLVLMDVSGSTGGDVEDHQILEVEKHSALILGQGLDSLGDRFSICGFSGQGRENCEFYVYKDFDDRWDSDAIGSILKARPRASTRIGVALRHAGGRLARVEAKQRLIILITDGRPMDSGYDPATRYAQYDIRVACEENRRMGIHTFGISTMENSRADMELMFPGSRFVILQDIRELPRVLPRMYIRLTV